MTLTFLMNIWGYKCLCPFLRSKNISKLLTPDEVYLKRGQSLTYEYLYQITNATTLWKLLLNILL